MNEGFLVINGIEEIRRQITQGSPLLSFRPVKPPAGISRGVPSENYEAYRSGLDSACADVVVCSIKKDREPVVLLSKRSRGKPFGGKWWIHGGALHCYRPVEEFLTERVEKECGLTPRIMALVAIARTCSYKVVGSTLQPCFLGLVDYGDLSKAIVDCDHEAMKAFTKEEYQRLLPRETHWYVNGVTMAAIDSLNI